MKWLANELRETRLPISACGVCERSLDACTSTEPDKTPAPGDLTVCAYCGTLYQFDAKLHLERVELEAQARLLDRLDAKTRYLVERIQKDFRVKPPVRS